jgi:hypothetical protein
MDVDIHTHTHTHTHTHRRPITVDLGNMGDVLPNPTGNRHGSLEGKILKSLLFGDFIYIANTGALTFRTLEASARLSFKLSTDSRVLILVCFPYMLQNGTFVHI